MANNKVIYGNTTIMDITDTTAEAADVAEGAVFYDKAGVRTVGIGSGGGVFVAVAGTTTYDELKSAIDSRKKIVLINDYNGVDGGSTGRCIPSYVYYNARHICMEFVAESKLQYIEVDKQDQWSFYGSFLIYEPAAENEYGVIKTNPSESITLNADGQLQVGGRMGQFPTTTGIYAPNNRAPRMVADYDLLITDALGMNMTGNRSLGVVSGMAVTCKSAAAGATEYRVTNNYTNRILCKLAEGGFASRDEATSKAEQIVPVLSVTINGSTFTPDSSANSSNDIVIKTSDTLNPDTAITSIRLFGTMGAYASIHTGNGIKSESGGRNLLLGGGVIKSGSSNDNALVGNGIYSSGNGVAAFGRYHILRKNRGFFAGTGHDSTNAPSEGASAVGQYSYMDANTMFAVGIGSSQTDRRNALEVTSDGGIILRSPNGTRFKIKVSDTGEITATAV